MLAFLINSTIAIGDLCRSLTGFISLLHHLKTQGYEVYIDFAREDFAPLFPYDLHGCKRLSTNYHYLPMETQVKVINLSWNKQTTGRSPLRTNCDFNQAVSEYFKIDVESLKDLGEGNVSEQIIVPDDSTVPVFDMVICPYVLNNFYIKMISPSFWQDLVNKLKDKGYSIGVLGKLVLPTDDQLKEIESDISRFKDPSFLQFNTTKWLENCDYYTDVPFIKTCNILNKMKYCYIGPDSGLQHVVNKLQVPAIELHPNQNVMISKFSKFNERTELGRPISVYDVINRIEKMF